MLCALGLFGSRVAGATPIRVEVQPLVNTSELAATDVEVLDSLVRSELSKLAQESFEVVPAPAASGSCDSACSVSESAARGAGRLVKGSVAVFGGGFVGTLELYEVSSGQLLATATTGVVADSRALLDGLRKAAGELRGNIDPESAEESPAPATTAPVIAIVEPKPATAVLRVDTTPPGATIYIQRIGNRAIAGTAPIEKTLLPLDYRVIAKLPEHETATAEVRLDPFEVESVHLTLRRIYPTSPHKKLGHVAFWPGLVVVGLGFVFMNRAMDDALEYRVTLSADAQESSRRMVGGMWASFGIGTAAVITGIVLWTATPSSKEYWERSHGALAVAPTPDGGLAVAYGRRF